MHLDRCVSKADIQIAKTFVERCSRLLRNANDNHFYNNSTKKNAGGIRKRGDGHARSQF